MDDAITEFFDELASRGHEPLLQRGTGTIRFDVRDGEEIDRWRVSMMGETIEVKHGGGSADCVVRAERALFSRIVSGRTNAMAAMLRGVLTVEGDAVSLVLFQRLFPSPPPGADRPNPRRAKARG